MAFVWTNLFTNETLTRAAFITNLRARIDEDSEDTITDLQIIELIRQGNYDINFRTKLLPEYAIGIGSETSKAPSDDGSAVYTLPNNMSELYDLYHTDDNSPTNYTTVVPYNLQQLQADGRASSSDLRYIRNGQEVQVFGSDTDVGDFLAYGARIPTFPSADDEYIDLPDVYLELMYLWCEWKYWVRRRQTEEELTKQALYEARSAQVASQVEDQYLTKGVTAYG